MGMLVPKRIGVWSKRHRCRGTQPGLGSSSSHLHSEAPTQSTYCGKKNLGVPRADHPPKQFYTSTQGHLCLVCDGGDWKPVVDKYVGEPPSNPISMATTPHGKAVRKVHNPGQGSICQGFLYLTDTLCKCFPYVNYCPKTFSPCPT